MTYVSHCSANHVIVETSANNHVIVETSANNHVIVETMLSDTQEGKGVRSADID